LETREKCLQRPVNIGSGAHCEKYPARRMQNSNVEVLLRGENKEAIFHVQIATDVEGDNIRVVTMYTPDADEWDEGFRKRRTK